MPQDAALLRVKILPADLKPHHVQKFLANTPPLLPTFYNCPYADTNPGKSNDTGLQYFPSSEIPCDINLAFITPSEDTASGKFGNTTSDQYLCHLRDRKAIQQFVGHMKSMGRRIITSFIDSPNIHWDQVNVENFVRNTEGEICADGTVFTNQLMDDYQPVGRMWDAETPEPLAMAEVMKACFLRGIQRDPDNYVFVYTTYANRPDIDPVILGMKIDPNGSDVDKALYALGFYQVSDFITKRGSLSYLETMSYGGDAPSRFAEADTYAVQYLGGGDPTTLDDMRKFISIGVAPGITDEADALTIAAACDPTKAQGYGRFMVWAGNSPDGLNLFNAMHNAQSQPMPKSVPTVWTPESVVGMETAGLNIDLAGNLQSLHGWLFRMADVISRRIPEICHQFSAVLVDELATAVSAEPAKAVKSWMNTLSLGFL